MQPDGVSVTLGVGSAAYQKTLAASLLQAGMLRRVLNTDPYLEIHDPGPDGSLKVVKRFPINRRINQLFWGPWRRLPEKLRPSDPGIITAMLADRLWSRWIPSCSVFHGWMGFSLASLQVAKRQGAVTLVENAGRHPRHWHRVTAEEHERFGIKRKERRPLLSPALIRRMEREYELCDRVAVPSALAYRSFAEFGLADKAVVVLLGTDTQLFSPRPRTEKRPLFRACFVGRVELAKGAGYLLQAWKRLALPNAELVLVGRVNTEMNSLLRTHADSTVRILGFLSPEELAERYRDSDLFVFPSVNEGLAQVLLEAMASGLAVVASDMSGADDCLTEGKEGFIVPARNVDRLAEAILWCYQHPDETRAMGLAARARIEKQFTLDHYNQRQIALYRSLAAKHTSPLAEG
jgi:glycosyltransferase involved in cell wall biosynthesis